MDISILKNNIATVCEKIEKAAALSGRKRADIVLCAASKTRTFDEISESAKYGIDMFGENHAQELEANFDSGAYLGKPASFIGHLQTNKVKDIIKRVELIHSIDSLRLAYEAEKQAERADCETDILLEINIAGEKSKSGFSPEEVIEAIYEIAELPRIHIRGLMSIPPICEDNTKNRKYFSKLNNMFLDIGTKKIDNSSMDILSMGMSDDFDVAIAEGSTLVRIGTALFGKRKYSM